MEDRTVDDDVRRLEWEAACRESLARVEADPVALAEWRAESRAVAECDVTVVEDYD